MASLANDSLHDAEINSCHDQENLKKEENLQSRILKQVEYYFSDSNIINDDFLLTEIGRDPEGWINLSTIASFNKMKKLTDSLDEILLALKGSKTLLIHQDRPAIKRVEPIPIKDPFYEKKVIVLSGIAEKDDIRKKTQIQEKLSEAAFPCSNIRCFPPFVNISKDTKLAVYRHRLPEKKFYLLSFENTDQANSALKLVRSWWPSAYSNLLAWKPPQPKTQNNRAGNDPDTAPGQQKSRKKIDPMPPVSSSSDRPRIKILLPDQNKPYVVVTRPPFIPPTEESVGFEDGWKEKLKEKQSKQLPALPPKQQSIGISCHFEDPAVVNFVK